MNVLCQYNGHSHRPPEKRCKGRNLYDNFRKLKLQFKIHMTAASLSAKKDSKVSFMWYWCGRANPTRGRSAA